MDVGAQLDLSLLSQEDPAALARIFPSWDSVDISEEAEDGQLVRSRITVPQHMSVCLCQALSGYCAAVYAAAPHSMPSAALLRVSQAPLAAVCASYLRAATARRNGLPQRAALQLHFDLQFAQQCLLSSSSSSTSPPPPVQESLSALERHIDPFDLQVFSPHMAVRAKRAVLRQSGLLGVLVPPDRHALLASIKSSLPPPTQEQQQQQQQQHNVMWSCSHRPERVPTVPVPRRKRESAVLSGSAAGSKLLSASAAALASTTPDKASPLLSGASSRRRRPRDRSPVARAAGSFFEAMSTSFFGGGK